VKIAIVVGWTLLAVEAVIVVSMFVNPNMGDDAAGRGMARGFGLVLGPVLIASALLFVWVSAVGRAPRSGPARIEEEPMTDDQRLGTNDP
jgi:hypothetical protein